jgi:hypothetical protein
VALIPNPPPEVREWADSLDAWTTSNRYHIDLLPGAWKQPYVSVPPYWAAKVGRIGATLDTARTADAPRRGDIVFPDSVMRIVLDFELNAFCAAGAGQGQYLGRCVWQWERTRGSSVPRLGRVTFLQTGLDQPSATFKEAVERYVARTRFPLPKAIAPSKGGGPCQ